MKIGDIHTHGAFSNEPEGMLSLFDSLLLESDIRLSRSLNFAFSRSRFAFSDLAVCADISAKILRFSSCSWTSLVWRSFSVGGGGGEGFVSWIVVGEIRTSGSVLFASCPCDSSSIEFLEESATSDVIIASSDSSSGAGNNVVCWVRFDWRLRCLANRRLIESGTGSTAMVNLTGLMGIWIGSHGLFSGSV